MNEVNEDMKEVNIDTKDMNEDTKEVNVDKKEEVQNKINIPDLPYSPATQIAIKEYYKFIASGKTSSTLVYKQNQNGNLETYDKKSGELVSSIPLYYYRPITKQEFDEMDALRVQTIIDIEEQIDIQRELLRKAHIEYVTTKDASNFMTINATLNNLELKKVNARTAIRDTKEIESIDKRDIELEKIHEKRKAKNIFVNIYRDFLLWKLYGRYTDSKDVVESSETITLEKGEVFLKSGKIARIFNDIDEENNNLSIFKIKEFKYKDIKYLSPYQAFEAIRLAEAGYDSLRDEVMKSRTIRNIRLIGKKISTPLKDTYSLWMDILENYYNQHPELKKDLLATNSDILVFANATVYIGGIGIAGTEDVLDPEKWKTLKTLEPNIVGKILMTLRNRFKEENESAPLEGGSIDKKKIALEKKKAAIIHHMKNRH